MPKPSAADGRVLVKMKAAGVTPLDQSILSGGHPRARAPMVLGGEGAGVVEHPGDSDFPAGSRVMFAGPYGVTEDGTYSEWLAVRTEHHAKAEQAHALGFGEVVDLSVETLGDGVYRITEGYGTDIVIDAIGGEILGQALGTLAVGGSLTTLGYAAGRTATVDVTHLIWRRASIKSFSLFAQPPSAWKAAWSVVLPLLQSGAIKPIVAKTYPLEEAVDALRHLVEGRLFGRVVLTI